MVSEEDGHIIKEDGGLFKRDRKYNNLFVWLTTDSNRIS